MQTYFLRKTHLQNSTIKEKEKFRTFTKLSNSNYYTCCLSISNADSFQISIHYNYPYLIFYSNIHNNLCNESKHQSSFQSWDRFIYNFSLSLKISYYRNNPESKNGKEWMKIVQTTHKQLETTTTVVATASEFGLEVAKPYLS